MRVLIVGAGAVGATYGYHLSQGGAEVSFFVKEKYRTELESGMHLYHLGLMGRYKQHHYTQYSVFSEFSELQDESFDYVIFSFDSTALQADWLKSFSATVDQNAALVMLQPDLKDKQKLEEYFASDRIVQGLIGFIAFQAPLKGAPKPLKADSPEGIAWFLPPVAGFFENNVHGKRLKAVLKKGGFRSSLSSDMQTNASMSTARFIPMIASLELAGWRLDQLFTPEHFPLAVAAAREASAAVKQRQLPAKQVTGKKFGKFMSMLVPFSRRFFPFDIEVYLQYHFGKVGDQTVVMLESFVEEADKVASSQSQALQILKEKLKSKRAG